jgi:GNAT superfamily N-acetyltransferase
MPDLTLRMNDAEDVGAVLEMSASNGFTRRTRESWDGEAMRAALAFRGGDLIGAIPFARRSIQIPGAPAFRCGYLSGVVIAEGHRGTGVGTRLLNYLTDASVTDGFMLNSFLDDEAYRWYTRAGFTAAVRVRSMIRLQDASVSYSGESCRITDISDGLVDGRLAKHLKRLFDEQFAETGGFEVRDESFWNRRLKYHFYRAFNKYYLLSSRDETAYAIASHNLHPRADGQIDVLELCARTATQWQELLNGVQRLAGRVGTQAVRLSVVAGSEQEAMLTDAGFTESGRYDILFRAAAGRLVDTRCWTHVAWDYA